ncbi:MAG: hypothetical protein JWR19_1503 [Pedosphaera sp.]|nr:hypothetical protein [Pedosphaera sp.]
MKQFIMVVGVVVLLAASHVYSGSAIGRGTGTKPNMQPGVPTGGNLTLPATGNPPTSGNLTPPSSGTPPTSGNLTVPNIGNTPTGGNLTPPDNGEPATSGDLTPPSVGPPSTSGDFTPPDTGDPPNSGPPMIPQSPVDPPAAPNRTFGTPFRGNGASQLNHRGGAHSLQERRGNQFNGSGGINGIAPNDGMDNPQ